jgi:hypothetical protein
MHVSGDKSESEQPLHRAMAAAVAAAPMRGMRGFDSAAFQSLAPPPMPADAFGGGDADDEGALDALDAGTAIDVGTGALRTVGDAVQRLRERVQAQVRLATQQGTRPTIALGGDRSVRVAFYTLLPPPQQRALFLELMGQVDLWPRVRHLFGAPPYDFLEPGDASRFSAAGFATGRANMAHDEVRAVANYSQYGHGQFIDAYRREYKVVQQGRTPALDTDVLLFEPNGVARAPVLIVHVRVRKTSRRTRLQALADVQRRRTVLFPTPGEQIEIRLTPQMTGVLTGAETVAEEAAFGARRLIIRVERVVPRGRSANTAAMIATVTS